MRLKPLAFAPAHALAAVLLATAACHALAADTPIYAIQGSGTLSPLLGQTVTTTGVVTKLTNNGFYMQDPTGDGNPNTSDGILVFTSTPPTVAVGQWIRLTGVVAEFNVGSATNAVTLARRVTELTGPTGITVLANGISITPTVLTLPEIVNDEIEKYEGMLVTIPGPLFASQNFFQGRYGQVTLSVGGRLETPTNRFRPGPQALALADENARRRIILDDGVSLQNPNPVPYLGADGTLRAGDTLASVTGVLDYGLTTASNADPGDYKIQPTVPPVFTRSNPRTAAPEPVGGNVRVASFNVLNFFTTFTNGQTVFGQAGQGCTIGTGAGASTTAGNCRGANNLAEFIRQRTKIVEAIAAINADVVGLMEIQNNGPAAVGNLVDELNARLGTGTYAAVPDPTGSSNGGSGTDAIKVSMIYKPRRFVAVSTPLSDPAAIHNRPPLAEIFTLANGEKFSVVVNHFKSKGSCPAAGDADATGNVDSGDGQGCWNALRVAQAGALRSFVARIQNDSASNDVLLIGDFNAYGQEDPIADLTGSGYVDQIGRFNNFGYSYVFNGESGRLDHAISTGPLTPKVGRAIHWHINADEPSVIDYNTEFKAPATTCGGLCAPDGYTATPYRASDHDPVVVGLNIFKTIPGTPGADTLLGTPGDDVFVGGSSNDTMTGNGGINVYVYNSVRDGVDQITDFTPSRDAVDLRGALAALGYAGTDAVADGWVRVVQLDTGASVQVGSGLKLRGSFRPLVTLLGVPASSVVLSRDLIVR